MAQYPKRIPYGMMNFVDVREDNCYYVDKTRFIPLIEQANKFFFFIRPRRFGKSLTLSMLRHYYDMFRSSLPWNGNGSLRRNQLSYCLFRGEGFCRNSLISAQFLKKCAILHHFYAFRRTKIRNNR